MVVKAVPPTPADQTYTIEGLTAKEAAVLYGICNQDYTIPNALKAAEVYGQEFIELVRVFQLNMREALRQAKVIAYITEK